MTPLNPTICKKITCQVLHDKVDWIKLPTASSKKKRFASLPQRLPTEKCIPSIAAYLNIARILHSIKEPLTPI
ncbi:MAG: hypothetical protein ACKVZH_11690 [Blastocatellia bacterium]